MKNCNIFIAASPLQLLNSIEASYHFQTKNNILLFLQIKDDINLSQMNKLLDKFEWDEVRRIVLPQANKSKIFYVNSIQNALKDIKKNVISKLFVGEYRSDHITHITNYLDSKEVFLVDDGLALLNFNKYANQQSNKQKFRAMVYKFLSYKLSPIDYKFFTIFNLKQDNVIENKYSYIKQYMSEKIVESSVYFIGQPLVELSMLNENNYKNELKKVIDFYDSKKFVYILHRRQNEKLIKKLALVLGFEYKRFDQLIEVEMLNALTIPSEFATFYSTAIITLPKLLDNCMYRVFKINPIKINNKIADIPAIEKCYSEFIDNDIEVRVL